MEEQPIQDEIIEKLRIYSKPYAINAGFSILTSVLAFLIAFTVLFTIYNLLIGDLLVLIFGGAVDPRTILPKLSTEELAPLMDQYNALRTSLNLPAFPFSVVDLFSKYFSGDFGTNWVTGGAIAGELASLSGATEVIMSGALTLTIIILSPFIIIRVLEDINLYKSRLLDTVVKIIAITSPFLLFLIILIFQSVFDPGLIWEGVRIVPGWRDDVPSMARNFLPVLSISFFAIMVGLITIAAKLEIRTTLKLTYFSFFLGDFIFETLYMWPGLGRYFHASLMIRNIPVIFASVYNYGFMILIGFIIISLIPLPLKTDSLDEQSSRSLDEIVNQIRADFKHNRSERILIIGFLAFLVVLVGISFLTPFDPVHDDFNEGFLPLTAPGGAHIFGTNWAGQDIFSRILASLRLICLVGGISGLAAVIGFILTKLLPRGQKHISNLLPTVIITGLFLYIGNSISTTARLFDDQYLWLPLSTLFIILLISLPMGMIIGCQFQQNKSELLLRKLRLSFGLGFITSVGLMEYGSFLGILARRYNITIGMELNVARPFLFMFDWNVTAPLFAFVIVMILLLCFTFLPFDLSRRREGNSSIMNQEILPIEYDESEL